MNTIITADSSPYPPVKVTRENVRFAAQLGFAIEPDTLTAIRDLAQNLRAVSAERSMFSRAYCSAAPIPNMRIYSAG